MSVTTLEIRPYLKVQLDHLANEAVALYLAQQRRISARIQEGLAQAQRGAFVADKEMDAFFARYSEPQA